jgi:hypothetical protein
MEMYLEKLFAGFFVVCALECAYEHCFKLVEFLAQFQCLVCVKKPIFPSFIFFVVSPP